MADEVTTTTQPSATPAAGEDNLTVSMLLEKKAALERSLHEERGKVASLTAERDTFRSENADYKVTNKKSELLKAHVKALGSDFVIENRDELEDTVRDLADGPKLSEAVLRAVNGFKRPAPKPEERTPQQMAGPFSRPAASGTTPARDGNATPEKPPKDYTYADMEQLFRTDPERYKQVRAARADGH